MNSIIRMIIRCIFICTFLAFQHPLQGSPQKELNELPIDQSEENTEIDKEKPLNSEEKTTNYLDLLEPLLTEKDPVILFTNARNEKNIKEWAAHHLLIGFDLVYIFDHKSDEPLADKFKGFDPRVIIERCELENPVKLPLMAKAAVIGKQVNAAWILYLDADEFVILNDYSHVKDLLNDFSHADSVGINWLMFGTNKQVREPKGLILENYTKSDLLLNQHVKTFTRPLQIIDIFNPHCYCLADQMKAFSINNQSLAAVPYFNEWPIEYFKAPAYLAHYLYQSEESYIKRKVSIPRDDSSAYRDIDTKIHSYHNNYENFDPKDKYAEQTQRFLDYFDQENSLIDMGSIGSDLEK